MVQTEITLELVDATQAHQLDAFLLLEDRQHVEGQVLHVVDFTGNQRVGARRLIGHDAQHKLIDLDVLAAGQEVRCFLARHIGRIALQHHGIAWPPLILEEAERTRADRIADALVRRRCREPCRHHYGQRRVGLAQHIEEQRERLLEDQSDRLRILGLKRFGIRHQHLAQRIADRPPPQRGDAILGRHGISIMPLQAIAQHEAPDELVGARLVAFDHLRLDLALLVHGKQHVEDMQSERSGDRRGDDMGIEDGDLGLENHRQRPGRPRFPRPDQRGARQCSAASQGGSTSNSNATHSLSFSPERRR